MIRIGDLQFGPQEREAIQRVVDRAWVSEGPEVRAFEDEFAAWVGVRCCVAVSSGTAALIVGLQASRDLLPVERVLLPALTFIADANAVVLAGMEPVFADVEPDTYTMDPHEVGRHEFDLALPVHLFGFPCDMEGIVKRAGWHTRPVIVAEDACEAHGTMVDGKRAGAVGTWGAFSFYIAHTVQAGEFGCLVTDNPELADTFRSLKAHGRVCTCRECTRNTTGCHRLKAGQQDPRFLSLRPGWNAKASEFSAAIARVQLAKVDENLERRRANVRLLNSLLSPASDAVQTPPFREDVGYMAYPLVLRQPGIRDTVIQALATQGVESRPMFGCIPTQQPWYRAYHGIGEWPNAERLGADGFYVGCHQYLSTADVRRVAASIKDVLRDIERGAL